MLDPAIGIGMDQRVLEGSLTTLLAAAGAQLAPGQARAMGRFREINML